MHAYGLFTPEETAEWERKRKKALEHVDGDKVYRPDGPNPYNESARRRVDAVMRTFEVEKLRRIRARPESVTDCLLVAFHEKGTEPLTWEDVFIHGLPDRIDKANTPETRKHVHAVLGSLLHIPLSWGMSAATRFFRGTGKQGKPPWSDKPGAGILSKDYGWKGYEADWFMRFFYAWPFTDLFLKDDSPDCYGEEAAEIEEEGGDRWAATRKERDDDFIQSLLDILEKRGLADEIDKPDIPKPKPRKVKVFKPGSRIMTNTVRDLPEGSHFRFSIHLKEMKNRGEEGEKKITRHYAFEAVYKGRVKPGLYEVHPIVSGVATGLTHVPRRAFDDAEYVGPWEGSIEEDFIAKRYEVKGWSSWEYRWVWKPVKTKTTPGH